MMTNEVIDTLKKNLPNEYWQYISTTTSSDRDYELIESTNEDNTYSLMLKLPKNVSVLIIKNLEKMKELLGVEKEFLVGDCDYILILPKTKQIVCLELKRRKKYTKEKKRKKPRDIKSCQQVLCGPFWLHLFYHSFILKEDDIDEREVLYTSLFNEWKFLGLVVELYQEKNRGQRCNNGLYTGYPLYNKNNFPIYKVEMIGKTIKFLDLHRLNQDIKREVFKE